MHLRAIKLRGFKSFPEPVEVRLERGVAVVVGPNGSGKSNISDALLWAAGSLAPSELRAEKPDDVLFAGGKDRPPADYCEVELLFDNEDGALEELPFAEVSFMRRLHRLLPGRAGARTWPQGSPGMSAYPRHTACCRAGLRHLFQASAVVSALELRLARKRLGG